MADRAKSVLGPDCGRAGQSSITRTYETQVFIRAERE